jgi:hypothetical protein
MIVMILKKRMAGCPPSHIGTEDFALCGFENNEHIIAEMTEDFLDVIFKDRGQTLI